MIKECARQYLSELIRSLDVLPLDKLDEICELLIKAYNGGRRIYSMGNGGSAATAAHFVCDLVKGCGVNEKKKFKASCLCDNVPLLTAWANDVSYEAVFRSQLEQQLEKGDLVVAFTGSGNSKNILKAVEYANSIGAISVAFTGFQGGKVKGIAKYCLVVPSDNMERIEDLHLVIEHLIHMYLFEAIKLGPI